MKSLEETIKQKCKFLGNNEIPYKLYNFIEPTDSNTDISLFLTNPNIESENIITLLEEMTPLTVYIYSCLKYRGCRRFTDVSFNLKFHNSTLKFKNIIDLSGQDLENPIDEVTATKNLIKSRGYYTTFSEPFRIEIILSVVNDLQVFDPDISYEEENLIEEFTPDEDEEEEEVEVINDTKTFKTGNCVICLEKESNVLFCNCSHICICNNCLEVKKLSKCPICKTENNVLREIY